MSDLAWMLIPLSALASLEFARHFNIFPDERREVIGVVLLTVFIWVFAWLGFAGMTWFPADSREYLLRFWMLIGALVLLVVSLLLIAAGWSIRTARLGGIWGLAVALGVLGLGGAFGTAGLRGLNFPELWWQPAIPLQADLLGETVDQVSEFGIGDDNSGRVVIVRLDSPALEWTLRALVAAYRGQDFIWRQSPVWRGAVPSNWFRWVTLREMPQGGESIILWARDDLFLDGQ
jgi:hypothetical protein